MIKNVQPPLTKRERWKKDVVHGYHPDKAQKRVHPCAYATTQWIHSNIFVLSNIPNLSAHHAAFAIGVPFLRRGAGEVPFYFLILP